MKKTIASLALFALAGYAQAQSTTIHLFNHNLQAWHTMFDRCGPEYCIKKITDYIDQNAPIDLITVQETDHGGKNFGQFLNNTYQVSDKIGDATVFYNQNQWQL